MELTSEEGGMMEETITEASSLDKHARISAGEVTVAQGLKCNRCGLVRPYNRATCLCKPSEGSEE